jgi:hypothetical protein
MKNNILLSIVFSLVLNLPFSSYGQFIPTYYPPFYWRIDTLKKYASTIKREKVTINKVDSITGKKIGHTIHKNIITMNGKEISENEVDLYLTIFPSSALQLKKSQRSYNVIYTTMVIGLFDLIPSYLADFDLSNNKKITTFDKVSGGIMSTCGVICGIAIIFESHHHHKAIKLYNEEIMKLHK